LVILNFVIDLNNIKIPVSAILGLLIGLIIGIIVGIINKGYFLEIIMRSILSGIIMGGVLFLVEQLLRNYAPEIFEESTKNTGIDIKEEDENISLEEIYGSVKEESPEPRSQEYTFGDNFQESISAFESADRTPEETTFSELNEFSLKSSFPEFERESSVEESLGSFEEQKDINQTPEFSPVEFRKIEITQSELGVTKESKGGMTNEFIIPPKGSKPIPKDYKKLAQIIRTKLHEEE